jgi:hypothetical protein
VLTGHLRRTENYTRRSDYTGRTYVSPFNHKITEGYIKALIPGIVIATVFAGVNWRGDVLSFLRGALPVIAAFIGLIAIFIDITDIRDRAQAKKKEATVEPRQE